MYLLNLRQSLQVKASDASHLTKDKCNYLGPAGGKDLLTLGFPPRLFKIRNSSERYGFAHLLSEALGIRFQRRSFAVNWQHGIYSHAGPECIAPYLSCESSQNKRHLVVVGNARDARFVRLNGHENVIVAGLPFAYVPHSLRQRRRILLVFPGHSAEAAHERVKINLDYLDYIYQFRDHYEHIWISAYGLDAHQTFYQEARKMGFLVVLGAHPSDSRSLQRTRAILDSVTHVTSNTVGSHLFYALYAGCHVSICGPSYAYQKKEDGTIAHVRCSEEALLESCFYGGQFGADGVGGLFVESPISGIVDIDLGAKAIGADYVIRDPKVLRAVMRWGFGGQIQGYLTGAIQRTSRHARRLLSLRG